MPANQHSLCRFLSIQKLDATEVDRVFQKSP